MTKEEQNKIEHTSYIYPNPAETKTTLKIDGDGGMVWIEVVDLKGARVKFVYEGKLAKVTHHIPIDLHGIDKGTYRIIIRKEGKSESIQLLKV